MPRVADVRSAITVRRRGSSYRLTSAPTGLPATRRGTLDGDRYSPDRQWLTIPDLVELLGPAARAGCAGSSRTSTCSPSASTACSRFPPTSSATASRSANCAARSSCSPTAASPTTRPWSGCSSERGQPRHRADRGAARRPQGRGAPRRAGARLSIAASTAGTRRDRIDRGATQPCARDRLGERAELGAGVAADAAASPSGRARRATLSRDDPLDLVDRAAVARSCSAASASARRRARVAEQLVEQAPRSGGSRSPGERDEHGALALAQVVAARLAGDRGVAEDAEQVVAQLEGDAERQPEGAQRVELAGDAAGERARRSRAAPRTLYFADL